MPNVRYEYGTKRVANGYCAFVNRFELGRPMRAASYQDGFKSRHAAYRYARSMVRSLDRLPRLDRDASIGGA